VDRADAPHPRGAVEVEELAQEAARPLLHGEVELEADLLRPRQQAVAVGEGPAGLDEREVVVAHHVDHGLVEEVLRGLKVGVENGDVLKALVRDARHAVDHGAGLEALPVVAAHELDVVALLQRGDDRGVDLLAHRLAGGVVAHLLG
jgi:hypothetical protein